MTVIQQHAIIGSIFFLILTAGCDSPGVSSHEKTMEVTILLPADTQKYWETITGEEDFQKAAALPFVRKKVVVPNSPDLIRASADAAAREIGPTQAGPTTIIYLKIENGTAYALLNIDRDGWAGVSYTWAYCHPIVEKTLLQFKNIKRVVWNEAPDEKAPNPTLNQTAARKPVLNSDGTANTNQISIAPAGHPDSHPAELNHGISIDDAVLVYMITNRDQSTRFVYFIEPTSLLQDLSPRWGSRYQVHMIQDAEGVNPTTTEHPRSARPHIRLKGTDKEGCILEVQIERVQGDEAEAIGSYGHNFGSSAHRSRLKRLDNEWTVVTDKPLYFADYR